LSWISVYSATAVTWCRPYIRIIHSVKCSDRLLYTLMQALMWSWTLVWPLDRSVLCTLDSDLYFGLYFGCAWTLLISLLVLNVMMRMRWCCAADTAVSHVSIAHPVAHHIRPQYWHAALSQPRCSTEQEGCCERGTVDRSHEASAMSHVWLVHLLASYHSASVHRPTFLQGTRCQVLLSFGNNAIHSHRQCCFPPACLSFFIVLLRGVYTE